MELKEIHLKKELISIVQLMNLNRVNEFITKYLVDNEDVSIIDYMQILIQNDKSLDETNSLNSEDVEKSIYLLNILTESIFNQLNISVDSYRKQVDEIVDSIKDDSNFEQFFINVIKLTKKNKTLIRVASNFFHLLVRMNVQLFYEDFSYIEIEDTDISLGNLAGCNLDYSKLNNVNISGANLNGASLINARWLHLTILEQNIIKEKVQIDKINLLATKQILVSICKQTNSIKIINYLSGHLIKLIKFKMQIQSFAESKNVFFALGSNKINVINAKSGKFICEFGYMDQQDLNEYYQLEFSGDCSLLVSLNQHDIIIWKCENWQKFRIIHHPDSTCLKIYNF